MTTTPEQMAREIVGLSEAELKAEFENFFGVCGWRRFFISRSEKKMYWVLFQAGYQLAREGRIT